MALSTGFGMSAAPALFRWTRSAQPGVSARREATSRVATGLVMEPELAGGGGARQRRAMTDPGGAAEGMAATFHDHRPSLELTDRPHVSKRAPAPSPADSDPHAL